MPTTLKQEGGRLGIHLSLLGAAEVSLRVPPALNQNQFHLLLPLLLLFPTPSSSPPPPALVTSHPGSRILVHIPYYISVIHMIYATSRFGEPFDEIAAPLGQQLHQKSHGETEDSRRKVIWHQFFKVSVIVNSHCKFTGMGA